MKESPIILGLSFFYHDSAAALIREGRVVAACQEERFTRVKHDDAFPAHAVEACLSIAGVTIDEIDYVVFYEKPITKFERLLDMYIRNWPRALRSFLQAMQVWFKDKLWIEHTIRNRLGFKGKVLFTEHHYAHAASAYYCSEFEEAVVVTMDGVGEWDTTTIGYGKGNEVRLTHAIHFPHSLGLLYSALTYYLGFKVNSAEYKVMGLAPYGNPERWIEKFRALIDIKDDGGMRLNMKYFSYEYGLRMTNRAFHALFGGPPRNPESPLEQRHKDIAAALQAITEEAVLKIVAHAQRLFPSRNLCLAGGVALNCVANGKILRSELFDDLYIQPASGDAGGAVGAALYVWHDVLKNPKRNDAMPNAFLGKRYSNEEIRRFLDKEAREMVGGKPIRYQTLDDRTLIPAVAKLIQGENVIGWFQGSSEFGPRALGSRSILADPRNKANWQKVNLKIKFRESFRPFAPSVLEEHAGEYFALTKPSPYMLLVADVKTTTIPAVTHVDNSARIQTVTRKDNPRYYDLLKEFYRLTGCPVVINTSFNVRGEPIVETPRDAFNCFLNTNMDYLVLENTLVAKEENKHLLSDEGLKKYLAQFQLD